MDAFLLYPLAVWEFGGRALNHFTRNLTTKKA